MEKRIGSLLENATLRVLAKIIELHTMEWPLGLKMCLGAYLGLCVIGQDKSFYINPSVTKTMKNFQLNKNLLVHLLDHLLMPI